MKENFEQNSFQMLRERESMWKAHNCHEKRENVIAAAMMTTRRDGGRNEISRPFFSLNHVLRWRARTAAEINEHHFGTEVA